MNCPLHAESLIAFEGLPFDDPFDESLPDWIFFYSKNAVRFFLHGLQNIKSNSFLPDTIRLACIGPGTAAFAKSTLAELQLPATIHFEGNGKPKASAVEFLKLAAGQTVLFPRARHSMRSVQRHLKDKIEAIDLIVYNNQFKQGIELSTSDICVFTSPLNVAAYCKLLDEAALSTAKKQLSVAIGQTTEKALKREGFQNIRTAKTAGEMGLWEVVE
ncbi:MAG: uroporphyrinogen-III synthase, partial [Bacteroidota bacterium]